ncbi:MAG: DUF4190 domain-containing protein, partial [Akkermansiaceae bacterium]|nr:DUF4190 domain-containing protein [Akkermansiaceae bacterium]MDP4647318.1 DUF4190 domain-containing protein [Akkermansiaceae bacterium]MDP4898977.1 DUF4190 domain-containing protein [Akkermansiaceae bacterium]
LVWYEGMTDWAPLSTTLHILEGTPAPPALTTPPLTTGIPQNSGLAITSMVLGILTFVACGLTAIPAVICGHMALGKIKRSQGTLAGRGFAITGLITGYLGFIVMIAAVAGLVAPIVLRASKKADTVQAVSNARQIGLALFGFEMEYDSYPDSTTAALVAEETNTPEITGTSSNARFRQLFSADLTDSEDMFYVKADGVSKPDGDISGDNALAPGECGFGYIENVRTDDNTPRPIAMAPFKIGSDQFDPQPLDNLAVILWTDNTVTTLPIDRATGTVLLDGQDLLDPSHPIWGGTAPSLLLPE